MAHSTVCDLFPKNCKLCQQGNGGIHVKSRHAHQQVEAYLERLHAVDSSLIDGLNQGHTLIYVDHQGRTKSGTYILDSPQVGGASTVPKHLSVSGYVEIYIHPKYLNSEKEALERLYHEFWHAFFWNQEHASHTQFDSFHACNFVYFISAQGLERLELPKQPPNMAAVRKVLAVVSPPESTTNAPPTSNTNTSQTGGLSIGNRVRITGGASRGKQGRVEEIHGHNIVVQLDSPYTIPNMGTVVQIITLDFYCERI